MGNVNIVQMMRLGILIYNIQTSFMVVYKNVQELITLLYKINYVNMIKVYIFQ